jgi:hypothetical protein
MAWGGLAHASVAAGSVAAGGPTLSAESQVAGHRLPVTLAHGSWAAKGSGRWSLVERSASLVDGSTTVSAAWTTPTVRTHSGQQIFTSSMLLGQHEGVGNASFTAVQSIRVCVVHEGCDAWFSFGMHNAPRTIQLTPFPVSVVVGEGLAVIWFGSPRHVSVQWRYSQRQHGADAAETDVIVTDR